MHDLYLGGIFFSTTDIIGCPGMRFRCTWCFCQNDIIFSFRLNQCNSVYVSTMRATAMSLSQQEQNCPLCDLMKDVNYFTCAMVLLEKQESGDLDGCSWPDTPPDRIFSLSPAKHRTYSASFYLRANGSLVSWSLMMAVDSSISWSKNADLFSVFKLYATKDIPFPEITIPKAQKILKNEKVVVCGQTSTPLCFSSNSGHSYACSSENPPNPLGNKSDSSQEVTDLDRDSYWHSLFNLQSEDGEWISDFESSSPFSTKSNFSIDSFDLEGVTFLDSLLSLEEEEDLEWISASKAELKYFHSPSLCCDSQLLLQTNETEQVKTDEPLFWPCQQEFKCDSEESWSSFCISPRKHINLLGTPAKSSAPKLKPRKRCTRELMSGKQNGDEAECRSRSETSRRCTLFTSNSAKRVPRDGKNSTRKYLVLNRVVSWERRYFALHQELPIEMLVGLEEFDGHEGLYSEFNGDVLILDE